MRFTNEELIEKLKNRLTNEGRKPLRMSERTLREQSEDLIALLANDDTELDDFIQKVLPSFERVNSNVEHDVAESLRRINEASVNGVQLRDAREAKKIRDANGSYDPKVVDNANISDAKSPSPDETIAQIRSQLAELMAERDKERSERLIRDKTESIKRFLRDKNITDGSWIDNATRLIQIDGETDVEATGENLLKLYNTQQSASAGAYTPSQPGPSSIAAEQQFSDIADLLKRDRERAGTV